MTGCAWPSDLIVEGNRLFILDQTRPRLRLQRGETYLNEVWIVVHLIGEGRGSGVFVDGVLHSKM